jgi:mRNA deadenylase 3'-5' endonuclease subunit Ccr4
MWEEDEIRTAFGQPLTGRDAPVLTHSLPLRSAYADALGGHEPPYTSANCSSAETVDYMWYTPQSMVGSGAGHAGQRPSMALMVLDAVLQVPDKHHVRFGLPNDTLPSDHVCLVADFRLGVML